MNGIASRIKEYIGGEKRVAAAYSGGMDSTLLMHTAGSIAECTGIFVDSPLISERQRSAAYDTAERLCLNIVTITLNMEDMPGVSDNDEMRCYHCKRAMFARIRKAADDMNAGLCMDGENHSDLSMIRPGRRAASEFGIRSPFAELGITRDEIIGAISELNIPPIVKDTCMATRIPEGTKITEKMLRLVESSESSVRGISGVRQLRVRIRGNDAIILTDPGEIRLLLDNAPEIRDEFEKKGLRAVIDKNGYAER